MNGLFIKISYCFTVSVLLKQTRLNAFSQFLKKLRRNNITVLKVELLLSNSVVLGLDIL